MKIKKQAGSLITSLRRRKMRRDKILFYVFFPFWAAVIMSILAAGLIAGACERIKTWAKERWR